MDFGLCFQLRSRIDRSMSPADLVAFNLSEKVSVLANPFLQYYLRKKNSIGRRSLPALQVSTNTSIASETILCV